MQAPHIPHTEIQRLAALKRLNIIDTDAEPRFDRYTRLASKLFGVPISLITLIDDERQWHKSRIGINTSELPRSLSFCGHTILQDKVLEVHDTHQDNRFFDNPMVTDNLALRFYAGAPLVSSNGYNLGAICIADTKPRNLTETEHESLMDLASMVSDELNVYVDELTGLSNRRGFKLVAETLLKNQASQAAKSSVVIFDLDNFKKINDSYGHQAGDHALQRFAELLSDVFRRSDSICRLGGDEFCVLLARAPESIANERIKMLRKRVAQDNDESGAPYSIEFTAGVYSADCGPNEQTVHQILNEADKLLYVNKARKKTQSWNIRA